MTQTETPKNEPSNTGFLFGLSIGAAVGALSAILINKNGEKEVVQNFESKVKDFFQDLISDIKTKKTDISKKIEFIDVKPEKEKESLMVHKKTHPKMFVKPKR